MKIESALKVINSHIEICKSINEKDDQVAKGIMIGLYLTDQINYKQHEYIDNCIRENELIDIENVKALEK